MYYNPLIDARNTLVISTYVNVHATQARYKRALYNIYMSLALNTNSSRTLATQQITITPSSVPTWDGGGGGGGGGTRTGF